MKNKIKIGVLMGGWGREREISLMSGKKMLEAVKRFGYEAIGIDPIEDNFISKLLEIDVAVLALHGKKGEDGCIQGLLEIYDIPYTGSGPLASAIAMNKVMTKNILIANNIPTPNFYVIDVNKNIEEEVEHIKKNFSLPIVCKPISEGSSIGVSIIREEEKLLPTIENTIKEFEEVFIEEYISGKTTTVGILGIDEDLQVLPVLELCPKREFYDYQAKYTPGMTEFIIPARLSEHVYKYTQEVALKTHKALSCYAVSRVDIIVSDDGIPYVTEVNTLPGMTEFSDLPKQAAFVGISYEEIINRLIKYALLRYEKKKKI